MSKRWPLDGRLLRIDIRQKTRMWAKRGTTPPCRQKKAPQRDTYPETGMQQTQLKKSWRKPLAGIGAGMMLVGTAGAQSSVTLYGIVDSGVTYTNNQQGHSAWQATAGNESGPRWGMLG